MTDARPEQPRTERTLESDTGLRLEGLLDHDMAAILAEQMAGLGPEDAPVRIDLTETDIEDATVVASLVDAFRQTSARVGRLELRSPPRTLAHTLYKIGALRGDALTVLDPRDH